MNSEELELSLRTEFESYLNSFLAEMRREAAEFQSRIEAQFDNQKAQFDEAFQEFGGRFDSGREFDAAFRGSVAEHLRMARDEGAKLTANAIAEAEKMAEAAAPVPIDFSGIAAAVNDISSKDSQSAILKTLVQHAEQYAPRGAFFIIKNEHFAGWKVFGVESDTAENAVREIHFPTSSDSVLGSAVQSLSTVESASGSHSDDASFLEPLEFGQPRRMCAIPLIARGRGVAVLYVDNGDTDSNINLEALETLVRVAGLTVELHASVPPAKIEEQPVEQTNLEETGYGEENAYGQETANRYADQFSTDSAPRFDETYREMPAEFPDAVAEDRTPDYSFDRSDAFQDEMSSAPDFASPADPAPWADEIPTTAADDASSEYSFGASDSVQEAFRPESDFTPTVEPVSGSESSFGVSDSFQETFRPDSDFTPPAEPGLVEEPHLSSDPFAGFPAADPSPAEQAFQPFEDPAPVSHPMPEADAGEFVFDSGQTAAPSSFGGLPFEKPAEEFEPAAALAGTGYSKAIEPTGEPSLSMPPSTRLSDRPVDLPIEVPEEERRLHNDARRFARLLVSEIKLYNEKKVIEGREARDLYERLREAIDRSREMYDKRVQPPVAAKFDYFHYEIVNALADGSAGRLGAGYPGPTV